MRYLVLGVLLVATGGCDALPRGGADRDESRLALSLEVTSVLDWGATGDISLTLGNQGNATARNVHVEVFVPSWLEFSSVEPAGTEVSVLTTGSETRLMYRLGDPALQPGETRTVVQRVRVPPQGRVDLAGAAQAPLDSAADAPDAPDAAPGGAVPSNRTLRARLVSPDGEEVGAEIRTVIPFAGADNRSATLPSASGPAGDARIEGDRIGPVQLGATRAQLRAAAPGARDTTFTLGEGMQESGITVPVSGNRTVVALMVNDRVTRIIVRDPGIRTERGLGVGSTFQQLRQAYGDPCVAPGAGGGTAVWFASLPGVSFAFDASSQAQDSAAAGLSDSARVRELWVRRGENGC